MPLAYLGGVECCVTMTGRFDLFRSYAGLKQAS